MKRSLLFLFLSLSISGFSQDEVEWFQPGQEWYYNVYCFQEFACGYTYYQVSGTETFNEQEAAVLTRIYLDEIVEEPLVDSEYLRFENDTVWRYSTVAQEWHMLWDFEAEVGDVWTIQEDVFYGYSYDGSEPETVPLFKVVVDSIAFYEEVPDSPLTNRRMIYTSPIVNELEESQYAFGPILEGVGPVNGAHDLIGNSTETLLPLQSPYFQCFLDDTELIYGEPGSPCYTLGTENIQQVQSGLIYPNPANDVIRWDDSFRAITIYDISGKVVLRNTQALNTQSLSLGNLDSGFYTVVAEKDDTLFSQKLIIEK